jgi:SsrA-binding protein
MNATKNRFSSNITIKNKKARFEYELLDFTEVGIVLKGSEIKSIREGKASLQEAYCHIKGNEMFIKGMNIAPYLESTYDNHEPTRERKLLLKKREIEKIKEKIEQKGLTIVPTKLYINSRGFAKLELALARGKKIHDKRHSIKEKDQKKELKQLKV